MPSNVNGVSAKAWEVIRRIVFETFDGKCAYCDEPVDAKRYHVDHVHPRIAGGQAVRANLVLACGACNAVAGYRVFGSFNKKREAVRARRGLGGDPAYTSAVSRRKHARKQQ